MNGLYPLFGTAFSSVGTRFGPYRFAAVDRLRAENPVKN